MRCNVRGIRISLLNVNRFNLLKVSNEGWIFYLYKEVLGNDVEEIFRNLLIIFFCCGY